MSVETRDVAHVANVSHAAVSRIFSGWPVAPAMPLTVIEQPDAAILKNWGMLR